MRAVLVLLSLLCLAGCSERPPAPTAPFAAGTSEEAVARVRGFLDAYKAADVDLALSHLCEPDTAARLMLERLLMPGSRFRISSYEIAGVTPLWDGKKPLFLVMTRIPRRAGQAFEHAYRVRAAEGCLERLFGEKAAPESGEPLVAPEGHPPLESGEGVPGADDSLHPALPAAPVQPGDEIFEL